MSYVAVCQHPYGSGFKLAVGRVEALICRDCSEWILTLAPDTRMAGVDDPLFAAQHWYGDDLAGYEQTISELAGRLPGWEPRDLLVFGRRELRTL